jgi:hypothetical protein
MAAGVIEFNPDGEGFGEQVDDLIAAAEAGNDLAFAVVAALSPRVAMSSDLDHVHRWVKTDEVHQGITAIRQYECRACLAHTVLTGPIGISSPFDVEESTNDGTQDTR